MVVVLGVRVEKNNISHFLICGVQYCVQCTYFNWNNKNIHFFQRIIDLFCKLPFKTWNILHVFTASCKTLQDFLRIKKDLENSLLITTAKLLSLMIFLDNPRSQKTVPFNISICGKKWQLLLTRFKDNKCGEPRLESISMFIFEFYFPEVVMLGQISGYNFTFLFLAL